MGARCEAAVAEKEAEETSDGEKFEYQAEVGFRLFIDFGAKNVIFMEWVDSRSLKL